MRPMKETLLGVSLCALVAGCGGAPHHVEAAARPVVEEAPRHAPVGRVHREGQGHVTALVGPAGGVLEISGGAKLEIPEGALTEPTEVTISISAETGAFANREDEQKVGPSLSVTPALASASSRSFVLTMPYVELPDGFHAADAAIAIESEMSEQRSQPGAATRTRWDHANARAHDHLFTAELRELPGYRFQFVVSK